MPVPLSIDDLDMSLADLRHALRKPASERNFRWAHDVCTYSRFVHINVWTFCADRARVHDEIIPLLVGAEKALERLAATPVTKGTEKKVAAYAGNIRRRVTNLKDNYLRGRRSAFAADAQLQGGSVSTTA